MKKILTILFVTALAIANYAQNIEDALRYSMDDLNGTARYRAMSGAFGALGGDFSSLNVNPAGSSVFANSQFAVSLNNFNTRNDASYFGNTTQNRDNSFDMNQAGVVFVLENRNKKSNWNKLTFAINYDNAKNYNNSIQTAGVNPNNSIANYFLSYANGLDLNIVNGSSFNYASLFFNEQQANLGYNAFIINEAPDYSNTNREYVSLVAAGGNYLQQNFVETAGYNSKLTFNAAGQYKDKFYFGINLNSHYIDYTRSSSFIENNSNNNSSTEYAVRSVTFLNDLYAFGTGFSFQLGTIYRATKELRFGLAYQSPTWFRISEELTQNAIGVRATTNDSFVPDVANPSPVTMIYEPYRLQTPGKWTGSAAYVFNKKGLISLDYTVKDYSSANFRPQNNFIAENNEISNILDITNEFRLGAEYKIRQVSLRSGYRYEQSPFKNNNVMGDLTGYSVGIGYNFGSTKLDLAYAHSQRETNMRMFSQGLTDAARINARNNSITATIIFEL
jgi:long-subunit fatty acid transport protein